jgi:hypothetical protein
MIKFTCARPMKPNRKAAQCSMNRISRFVEISIVWDEEVSGPVEVAVYLRIESPCSWRRDLKGYS